MVERDVDALVDRFGLAATARDPLRAIAAALTTDSRAPIAGAPPRRAVVDRHLADSLVALEMDAVRAADTIVDIGSGAGLPALPLAIALPEASVVALDSNTRKAAFIAGLICQCVIGNAQAVAARAESWGEGHGQFALAAARAVGPLAVLAEYAAPLLRIGGSLVAWRGRRDAEDERSAAVAAAELGLAVVEICRVVPFRGAEHRHIHRLEKVAPTPDRFPRREGVARKRPLGSV